MRPSSARFLTEGTRPTNAFGIEAVHWFIKQDDRRITEHRGSDAESLAHTQRELSDAPFRDGRESNEVEDLIDARFGDAAVLGERTVGARTRSDPGEEPVLRAAHRLRASASEGPCTSSPRSSPSLSWDG